MRTYLSDIISYRLILVFLSVMLSFLPDAFGQYKREKDATIPLEHFYIERDKQSPFRFLLSKLHFSLSTGYGHTFFRHNLAGFGLLTRTESGSYPYLFRNGNTSVSYADWVNDVTGSADSSAMTFAVSSDTASLGFRSRTLSIPLKGSVHLEFDRYRIGGGYSIEYTRVGDFKPISYGDRLASFQVDQPGFFMKHYFFMAGAKVYKYYSYGVVVDANIGGYRMGRSWNRALMQKGMYFNLGVSFEKEMSEYFRLFVRPSFEFKNYTMAIPETGLGIHHNLNAFYINIGATYRLPEIRRCFLKTCHAQINHAHGNKEYRSRRHPIWKKQNPHYGENYPTLIKYKGRNKKKLNPY